jgi:hypothetical protein
MAITIKCSGCLANLKVPDKAAGKNGKCPKCGILLKVPIPAVPVPKETFVDKVLHPPISPQLQTLNKPLPPLPDIFPDDNYYEIFGKAGSIVKTLEEIRNDLLGGRITRHTQARHIYPEPTRENIEDEDVEIHKKWIEKTNWRPIGSGLAKDEKLIQILYQPGYTAAWIGGYYGMFVVAIIVLILLLILTITFFSTDKTSGWNLQSYSLFNSTTYIKRRKEVPIFFLLGVVIIIILIAGTGILIGASIGYIYYWARKDSFLRPPDDDY